MKKVLLVLGLALCGTFAFAQTAKTTVPAKFSRDDAKLAPVQMQHQNAGEAQADYKASIFTKALSEVQNFQFDANNMTGILFGSNAVITDGSLGGNHTAGSEKSYWLRADSARYLLTTAFNQVYSLMGNTYTGTRNPIIQYMGADYGDEQDNGFMMISMVDACGSPDQGSVEDVVNAYVALPQVTLPTGCVMPVVRYYQVYRKYYDKCYLDYKLGNTWNAIEINVTGVDVSVNGYCLGYYENVLPHAVATQGTVQIRFRAYHDGDNNSHSIAGYGWAIDDVTILSNDAQYEWAFQDQYYLDGFYGLVPPGFNVPMSYVINARNTSIQNITGVKLTVNHRYWEDGEWVDNTDFEVERNQNNVPAGDISQKYLLRINERGFMVDTLGCTDDYVTVGDENRPEAYFQCQAQFYDTNVYGVGDPDALPTTYMYESLPTNHQGKNQFIITASANNLEDTILDRMTYTVSRYIDTTAANKARGITVPGYRWGHDNGVIATGSEFAYQFMSDHAHFTSDPDGGDQYYPGYEVYVRFNTPSEIPVDENNEPMVIRGLELIPTSNLTATAMNNALVTPTSYFDYDFGEGDGMNTYYFNNYTGLSQRHTQVVDGSNFASRDSLGYKLPEDNYNAVNILFPEQPTLFPNMSLYFGYSYAGGTGVFSLGNQQTSFRRTDAPDSTRSYRNEPALADYYNQVWPDNKVVDVIAYDALNFVPSGSSEIHSLNCYNIGEYPLVRLIVGPRMALPQCTVSAECNDDDADTNNVYWIARGGSNMCVYGDDTVAEGSSYGYNVFPGQPEENEEGDYVYDNGNVIDHIWVSHNGGAEVEYALDGSNDMVEAHEYDVIDHNHDADGWDPLLRRNYYTIYLENMTGEYTIRAEAHWAGLAVKPVESHVSLGLAPNPATSQVRVNISGVTGKVNCNILDMSGRVIYNADFNAENEQTINLNGVPAGAYFVRVTGDTFSKVERLIVR